MSAAAHTPGPWSGWEPGTNFAQSKKFISPVNGGKPIATVSSEYRTMETIANARVIAASPDMLAAHVENARILGFLVSELQGRIESGKLAAVAGCLDRSTAAIAKATGAA